MIDNNVLILGDFQIALVDLIVLGVLLVFLIIGLALGFLKQLTSLFGPVLSCVLAGFGCKKLANFVLDKIPAIVDPLKAKIGELFNSVVNVNSIDEATNTINELNIPSFLKTPIINVIKEKGTEFIVDFSENVTNLLTKWALIVICFLVIVVALLIVFFILKLIIKKIKDIKGINSVDKFLGGVFGLAKGFLICAVLYSIASLIPACSDFLSGGDVGSKMGGVMSFIVEYIIKIFV